MDSISRGGVAQQGANDPANGIDVDANSRSPWRTHGGIWRENPDFDAFLKEIEKLRHENEDAEIKPE